MWTSNSYVNVTLIPPRCADPILHIPLSISNLFECCNIFVMISLIYNACFRVLIYYCDIKCNVA